jgi:hypothetical protein
MNDVTDPPKRSEKVSFKEFKAKRMMKESQLAPNQ